MHMREFAFQKVDLQCTMSLLHVVELLSTSRLPFQRVYSLLHFGHEIVHTQKIRLNRFQLPVGGLPTVLVFRHPRGFFKQAAALVGAIAQDDFDHLQFDHRVRIGAHPGVHKEIQNVFEPAENAIQKGIRSHPNGKSCAQP